MTISKTAYDTTACQGFVVHAIAEGLKKVEILGYTIPAPGQNFCMITGSTAVEMAVPAFGHPFLLESGDNRRLIVDMRPFGRWDPSQAMFAIRNVVDHKLATLRANLNYLWIEHSPDILRDLSPLPMTVFAEFISKSVSRRFALNAREELDLAIHTAFFYLCQFSDEATLNEREQNRAAGIISRCLRCPAEDVFAYFDRANEGGEVRAIGRLKEFCEGAEVAAQSVRMQDLNSGVITQLVGGLWFGHNAPEMMAVALEHPPTWLTLLLAGLTDRTFQKSGLGRMLERGNPTQQKQFANALLSVLENSKSRTGEAATWNAL